MILKKILNTLLTGGKSSMEPVAAGKSDLGLVRKNNEDYFLLKPELGLWLVCDGMGGHAGGELASKMAAETVAKEVASGQTLTQAILESHKQVCTIEVTEEMQKKRPGSTIVALKIDGDKWQMAWVGDSRGWLQQGSKIQQVSHDQTVVQQLVDWGDITAEDALSHPDRHQLSQVLGQEKKEMLVGTASGTLSTGNCFLLATDGLAYWNEPHKLAAIIKENRKENLEQVIDTLIQVSLDNGGKDNVTCVLVQLKPRGQA